MTTKQWLERGSNLKYEIDSLNEAIEYVKDRLFAVTAVIGEDKVQESKINRHEIYLFKYLHLKEVLKRRISRLMTIHKETVRVISSISNPIYRTILTERYINGKTISEIAEIINYTDRWTAELSERAVKAVRKLVTNKTKKSADK